MFRNSFSRLILGFLVLTPVILIEAPQMLKWSSLTFTQQLTYVPILILWLALLIFIVIEFMNKKKRKK